jgi:hypothetical protein
VPRGWERALAVVAYVFHFTLADLHSLEMDELLEWLERARWLNEQRHGR